MKTTSSTAVGNRFLAWTGLRWYEARLRVLGDGTCSYEKRRVRAYEEVIAAYRVRNQRS